MSDYQDKIVRLRQIYTKPKDQKKLQRTEKALRKAIVNQELASHVIIKKIIDDARKDIENIDTLLAYDEKLNEKDSEYDRRLLFEKRDWIRNDIINRFSMKEEKSIQEGIQKSIDAVEARSKKYENLIKV